MPHGFKRDEEETRLAYERGHFTDPKKRSFVTLPKLGKSHIILAGPDVEAARLRIYERDMGECQLKLSKHCLGKVSYELCHLEHLKGGNADRCWCDHNLRISCEPCHIVKDGRQPWPEKYQ